MGTERYLAWRPAFSSHLYANTLASGPPPYALPFDLGALGWNGCQQLVSLDATTPLVTAGVYVDSPFMVPLALNLIGYTFHTQAIVLYSPAGVAVSNGLTATVGS